MKGIIGADLDKKGVIFDMDGVIFDTEVLWKNAFERANEFFGLQLTEEYRQSTCGKNEVMIREELKNSYPFLAVDEYRESMLKDVKEHIDSGEFEIKSNFINLINFLKENNICIALATSSLRQRAEKLFLLKGLSIKEIFDAYIFGDDVGKRAKPDPYIFLTTAERMNCKPENCFVLEDSINGIEAAVRGGFKPIMVRDLIEPNEFCIKNSKAIINDLIEAKSTIVESDCGDYYG